MWNYLIPVIVFLTMVVILTLLNKEDDKEKSKLNLKTITASVVVGILTFLCIKFKDHGQEPMMPGNYFDTIS